MKQESKEPAGSSYFFLMGRKERDYGAEIEGKRRRREELQRLPLHKYATIYLRQAGVIPSMIHIVP